LILKYVGGNSRDQFEGTVTHFTWRDSNDAAVGFSGALALESRFKPEISEIQVRRFKVLFCDILSDLIGVLPFRT
jgi:hypothetical protein